MVQTPEKHELIKSDIILGIVRNNEELLNEEVLKDRK
jgi:hypothetical protein